MLRYASTFLCSALLTWATAHTGAAADTPPIPDAALKGAIKTYAGKKAEAAVKALTDIKDRVELPKLTDAEGLVYTATSGEKKGSFAWKVPVLKDKKLDDAGKVVVKNFLVGAVKGYAADKALKQADADALEALAKDVVFLGDAPTQVAPVNTGKLALADLTEAQVRDSVKKYLDKNSKKLDPVKDVIYVEATKAKGDLLKYTYAGGKAAFEWQYAPRRAADKETADDKAKVAAALQGVLKDALSGEPVPAKKLKAGDLETATEAAAKATVSALAYTRWYDLTDEQFRTWLTDFAAKTPAPAELDAVKTFVDVTRQAPNLTYDRTAGADGKLDWNYLPVDGRRLTKDDERRVRAGLKALLTKAVESAEGAKAYPAGDLARLKAVIDAGTYTAQLQPGITMPDQVNEGLLKAIVKAELGSEASRGRIKEVVRVESEADQELLTKGLKYTTTPTRMIEWTYRPVKQADTLTPAEKADIEVKLKGFLADAVKGGGGMTEYTPNEQVYEYAKAVIDKAKTVPATVFTFDSLTPTVVREMVDRYLDANLKTKGELAEYVDIPSLLAPGGPLTFDKAAKGFARIEVAIAKTKDADLTAEQKTAAEKVIRKVLRGAFDSPVDSTKKLEKANLDDLLKNIDDTKMVPAIVILNAKDSETRRALEAQKERERQIQARLTEHGNRIRDLERDFDALADRLARVEQGGGGRSSTPAYTIRYVEQRTGRFGCKTTLVPVVVPVAP